MAGTERDEDGIPKKSFELEPASVPTNLLNTSTKTASFEGEKDNEKDKFEVSRSLRELISTDETKTLNTTFAPSKANASSGFSNFCEEISLDKFKVGQIWVLAHYLGCKSENYCEIKKIETSPSFTVRVALLKPVEQTVLPVCCGYFWVQNFTLIRCSPSWLKHLVKADYRGDNIYAIYPLEGEIWALKNNCDLEPPHKVQKFDSQIVLILNDNDNCTKVSSLVRVTGAVSVFRANVSVFKVPRSEVSRFAYRIPAFQLNEEKDGLLVGCWELNFGQVNDNSGGSLHIEDENEGDADAHNVEGLVGAKVTQNKKVVTLSNSYFSSAPSPEGGGSASGASAPKLFHSFVEALSSVSEEVLTATKVTDSSPTPRKPKRRKLSCPPPPLDKDKGPIAKLEKLGVSAKVKSAIPRINHSVMDGMDHMATSLGEMDFDSSFESADVALSLLHSIINKADEEKQMQRPISALWDEGLQRVLTGVQQIIFADNKMAADLEAARKRVQELEQTLYDKEIAWKEREKHLKDRVAKISAFCNELM